MMIVDTPVSTGFLGNGLEVVIALNQGRRQKTVMTSEHMTANP